ncbi:hypothetical protein [Actinoplanes xinjiangensis]|uniref:hypothetical protein n=1 Tax=Actinoplanes xinjiangensis TaxID=512350 RepID=UPI0011B7D462|nr:hypothetical protein [Actinoplanes xinjiangensis]
MRVAAGRIGLVTVVTAQLHSAHTVVLGVDVISKEFGAPQTRGPCPTLVPAGGHLADIGALKVVLSL